MDKEVQSVKPYLSEQTKDFLLILSIVGVVVLGALVYNKKK